MTVCGLRMRTVHAGAKGSYGVRRMAVELRKQEWPLLGCRRVHRLMLAAGLVGRQFARGRLNELWVADSTYIRVREGFGYLALVTDACSRRIIGRQFGLCHDAELMLGALGQAVCRRPCDGVIHHSDRGVQYLSERYRSFCARHGVVQSVGRIGNSYDHAMAESVFATLKRELLGTMVAWVLKTCGGCMTTSMVFTTPGGCIRSWGGRARSNMSGTFWHSAFRDRSRNAE